VIQLHKIPSEPQIALLYWCSIVRGKSQAIFWPMWGRGLWGQTPLYWYLFADGKKTRLLWKTTTNTVGDVVEEESWNAVNEGSLRAVEATAGWQLLDIRCVTTQVLFH